MKSVNPCTNEVIREYPEISLTDAFEAIEAADTAFHSWRREPFEARSRLMRQAAAVLRDRKDVYARLMTDEMGKPIREAQGEIEKCAWVCEYYAEHAAAFLEDETVPIDDFRQSFISFQPIGVVFAIMPWNYPFWQVFRFAAPSLMAGNVGILKHAENVPGCALAIEEVFREAGFPDHAFTSLMIDKQRAQKIIEHDLVRAVTLTGSTGAGKAVASQSGGALKKTVLELGGSDPYVVLPDADVSAAVAACAASRFLNGGQSCISAKRFIVVEAVRERFESELLAKIRDLTVGDPTDPATDIGPMARTDLRDGLHRQVEQSISEGAKCRVGGTVPDGPGAFYPPTLLTGVTDQMTAFREEMFGPVASVIPARDTEHAIELANQSVFGLGGAVFTTDLAEGVRIARDEIHTGTCVVNAFVKSDPRLPFGGIKESGYGRELSHYGLKEFVNVKTVCVAKG